MREKVYLYNLYGLYIKSDICFNEYLDECENSEDIDVHIKLKKILGTKKGIEHDENNMTFCLEGVAILKLKEKSIIYVEVLDKNRIDLIRSYLVGSIMGLVLIKKGKLALHGSAVSINEKSTIIMGTSGAGKSTLTAALIKSGHKLISDDICSINLDKDIFINSGYAAQRICEDVMENFNYNKEEYPYIDVENRVKYIVPVKNDFTYGKSILQAILMLEAKDIEEDLIYEIKGNEKLEILYANIYGDEFAKKLMDTNVILQGCIRIAREIPIYKIIRPKNKFSIYKRVELIENILNELINEVNLIKVN